MNYLNIQANASFALFISFFLGTISLGINYDRKNVG